MLELIIPVIFVLLVPTVIYVTTRGVSNSMLKTSRMGISKSEFRNREYGLVSHYKNMLRLREQYGYNMGPLETPGVTSKTMFRYSGVDGRPQDGEFFLCDGAVWRNNLGMPWSVRKHIMVPIEEPPAVAPPPKTFPYGDKGELWVFSNYRGEYTCPHGVGHGAHIHGCCEEMCCGRSDFPLRKKVA